MDENVNISIVPAKGASANNIKTTIAAIVGGLLIAVIVIVVLNYLRIVPVSVIPIFSFLPERTNPLFSENADNPSTPKEPEFRLLTAFPNWTTPQNPLVKSYSVLYTLQGKVDQITPDESGNFNITLIAKNGIDKVSLSAIGGKGTFRSLKKGTEISGSEVRAGDDVLVDVNLTADKDQQEKIFTSQVTDLSR